MFIFNAIIGAVLGILTKLATKEVMEKFLVYFLEKLANHSKSTIDDDVVKMVKDALKK